MILAVERSSVSFQHASALSLGADVAVLQGARDIATRFVSELDDRAWAFGQMQKRAPASLHPEAAFEEAWLVFKRGLGVRSEA